MPTMMMFWTYGDGVPETKLAFIPFAVDVIDEPKNELKLDVRSVYGLEALYTLYDVHGAGSGWEYDAPETLYPGGELFTNVTLALSN